MVFSNSFFSAFLGITEARDGNCLFLIHITLSIFQRKNYCQIEVLLPFGHMDLPVIFFDSKFAKIKIIEKDFVVYNSPNNYF